MLQCMSELFSWFQGFTVFLMSPLQRSSGSAESAAQRTQSSTPSIIPAEEPENRIPLGTTLASASGQQSGAVGEEDQDIATMLAQVRASSLGGHAHRRTGDG
jgi:hypothetical protein